MDRSDWTIEDYIKELDRVQELERQLDPDQVKLLTFYLEEEIKRRYSEEDRDKHALRF